MALFDGDDNVPRNTKPKPKPLDVMSIAALEEYRALLEAEISRVEQALTAKRAARNSADSVFRK